MGEEKGKRRYMRRAEGEGRDDQARALRRELQHLPSRDPNDPRHRRLRYCRYADDWILGFCGPRREAEEIKDRIRTFLPDHLKLELSEPKTLSTHRRTQSAPFLSYDIAVLAVDHKHAKRGHRSINGRIGPQVPGEGF